MAPAITFSALLVSLTFASAAAFAADDDNPIEIPFRGASLTVYDPLDLPTADNTVSPKPPPAGTTRYDIPVISRTAESDKPVNVPLTSRPAANIAWTLGAIALGAALDRDGDRHARRHSSSDALRSAVNTGNALPFLAMGAAGLAFLDSANPRLSRTGEAALQAGGLSAVSAFGLKYAFGRARPEAGFGPSSFGSNGIRRGDSSLPSIHTATIFGLLTPFAREYDQPWLYGLGALTALARVGDRKHWVSDTVAGAAIGFWLGDIAWHHHRDADRSGAYMIWQGRGLSFNWTFE